MEKIDQNYLIDAYLSNELEGEVLEQFEIQLILNKDLKKEVLFQQEIRETLADSQKSDLRKSFIDYHKDQVISHTSILHRIRTEAIAAIIVVMFIVGGGVTGLFNFSDNPQSLYESNFNPEINKMVVRSASNSTASNLEIGIDLYNENEFEDAIQYFDLEKDNVEATLYSGICYMHLELFNPAIDNFSFIINDNDNLFIDQAEWYLGLSYLKSDELNLAVDVFTTISANSGVYNSLATDMLNNLKE